MSDDANDPASQEIRDAIARVARTSELYRVTTYKGWRRHKDGSGKEITVELLDAGPRDHGRWMVIATDEDGREAHGNPDSDLKAAIAGVHWFDLDRDVVD